jgi:hypothetical protein
VISAAIRAVDGGSSVGPGWIMSMRGYPETQQSSDRSYREATARELWEQSVEWTGVEYETVGEREAEASASRA